MYGVASPSGHTPKFGKKKAKHAGPIPKPAWPIPKRAWHHTNPRLAHAKVGGGRDKASLGRNQAGMPRPPTCRPPRRPSAESGSSAGLEHRLPIGPGLEIGPAGLGYVPSPAPRPSCPIKPSGHNLNHWWHSATRDLRLCPDGLARPYVGGGRLGYPNFAKLPPAMMAALRVLLSVR
ncbi:hypothetical protein PGTUg99_034107 [Puccinia graminis f. sp. tritici]|uniref:Uncharacterized protein n=1 Tax=Puccinia graminis f. sp. tritici TaxID=56615 RepID=A0A5B0N0M8_PUCGR|nr:hypothetical protein PGTUg99_034107 [Puccinia graminis f. sp. tritici]